MGERLESRLAMAITVSTSPASPGVSEGWVTVVASEGDSVYVQEAASAKAGQSATQPALMIANNSSFLNSDQVDGIDNAVPGTSVPVYSEIRIYTGNVTSEAKTTFSTPSYPYLSIGGSQTQFVTGTYFLAHAVGSESRPPIDGILENGLGGTWSFHSDVDSEQFSITAISSIGPAPLTIRAILGDGTGGNNATIYSGVSDSIVVVWDTPQGNAAGLLANSPPKVTLNVGPNSAHTGYIVGPISASSPSRSTFSLSEATDLGVPAGDSFTIAAGTLRGVLTLEGVATPIRFQTASATDSTLVFQASGGYGWTPTFTATLDTGATSWRLLQGLQISGSLTKDATTGLPVVVFQGFASGQDVPLTRATMQASFVVLDANGAPASCTIAAGQDITRRLYVDLGQSGSTIKVDSPVRYSSAGLSASSSYAPPASHSVTLRATNVLLNSPIESQTSFLASGSQGGGALERLEFNAAISAQTYDVRLNDDPLTSQRQRSQLLVSASGSVGGGLSAGVAANAKSFFASVGNGDIRIEGQVAADYQTWLMQSSPVSLDQLSADPYLFTTTAEVSNARTGLIKGKIAAITLGNDIPSGYDNTEIGGSTLFNIVTLETSLDSIRIRAADALGNALATPFPYDALIDENSSNGDGSIVIDAVAASSHPVEFAASNDLTFNAALHSASDVIVRSDSGAIVMNSPITTAFGVISLAANSLTIGNSLQVLDTAFNTADPDIVLQARNGNMVLNGPVTAVGKILLLQGGAGNVIRGPSRIVADSLEVQADGSADLTTRVREISGSVSGGVVINEADELLIADLSAGAKKVSVTVGGYDKYPKNSDGTLVTEAAIQPALTATLADVNELYVSAPNGSVDVHVDSTSAIVMGNPATIQARTVGYNMMAAGRVKIISTAASFSVYDAPVAGGNAFQVRVASTGPLPGTFSSQLPGIYASTLVGDGFLKDQKASLDGVADLKVGDKVLLRQQSLKEQNGVYSVVNAGGLNKKWVLARQASFDTRAETAMNSWIVSLEGATQSQQLFRIEPFGEDDTDWLTVPLTATPVTNVGDSYKVKAIGSAVLSADYTVSDDGAGSRTRTLTSSEDTELPTFDGVKLSIGDLVLVSRGNIKDGKVNSSSIGVYQVVSLGDSSNPWTLLAVDDFKVGNVVANEGSLRASLTGKAFDVERDTLNYVAFNINPVSADARVEQIGSGDINDVVNFIVSTNLGANTDCGSLGKMLTLVQANFLQVPDPTDDTGQAQVTQKQLISFASSLASAAKPSDPTIQLTQSLPAITKRVVLDGAGIRAAMPGAGSSLIVIDGSRIAKLANFQATQSTTEVNGLSVYGGDASGTVISGITLGGFTKGAAVVADHASDVLLSNLKVGVNLSGAKLPNKFGVLLRNGAAGATTLLNSSIMASQQSAVSVADGSVLRIVGNTIGAVGKGNGVGVSIASGSVSLGTAAASVSIKRLSVNKVSSENNQFLLPTGFAQLSQLRIGLGVVSSRIAPPAGQDVAVITAISLPDPKSGAVKVTIDGTLQGIGAALVVDIGTYVTPSDDDQASFTVPSGVNVQDIYLGQPVTGVGVSANTTVAAIVSDGSGGYTITLSKPLERPGVQEVIFANGGRNQLDSNNYGMVATGGVTRVYNSTISNSIFDGIKVDDGQVTVGLGNGLNLGVDGRSPSKDRSAVFSNYVYGSGLAALRIGSKVTASNIQIQGNYFGVTAAGSVSQNKAGNIVGNPAIVDAVASGTVTEVTTPDSKKLKLGVTSHGLGTGAYVWVKIGSNVTGAAYRITRVDNNTIIAEWVFGSVKPTAVGDAVSISLYGTKNRAAQLASTGSIDFEGNQHGAQVGLPLASSGVGTGGSSGGVSAGRPTVRPIPRPPQR